MESKMKVLIAYDGAHPVEYFIHDLKKAGLPRKAEVLVLTVVESFIPPAAGCADFPMTDSALAYIEAMQEESEVRLKRELGDAQKMVDRAAKTIQSSFREWSVRAETCSGSPASAIVRKAGEWKADLIVVGTHDVSVKTRFFLGSIARSVLIHSKCSARIICEHLKEKQFVRIIIGVDGSRDSEIAVRTVLERTWPKGTSVRLVTGFDQHMASTIAFHPLPASAQPKAPGEEAWIRQMTAPYVKKLEKAGLRVSDFIKAGKPWKVLAGEAERWRADCIFVGARGLGRFDSFLLGSVSHAIASRAHCSVEVVRGKK